MGQEVERKFLVTGDGWRRDADEGTPMCQGYLNRDKQRTVRVRVAGRLAWLTVKGLTRGAVRAEYEYPIPPEEARELLALCEPPLIEKRRHRVEHAGMTWEVDVFDGDNAGLLVAEVELASPDQDFERPGWVGDEVTDDPRYYNANLVERPFRTW